MPGVHVPCDRVRSSSIAHESCAAFRSSSVGLNLPAPDSSSELESGSGSRERVLGTLPPTAPGSFVRIPQPKRDPLGKDKASLFHGKDGPMYSPPMQHILGLRPANFIDLDRSASPPTCMPEALSQQVVAAY